MVRLRLWPGQVGAAEQIILKLVQVAMIVGPVAQHGAIDRHSARRALGREHGRFEPAQRMAEHEHPVGIDVARLGQVAISGAKGVELRGIIDRRAWRAALAVAHAGFSTR